jgi:hypothetical protein
MHYFARQVPFGKTPSLLRNFAEKLGIAFVEVKHR